MVNSLAYEAVGYSAKIFSTAYAASMRRHCGTVIPSKFINPMAQPLLRKFDQLKVWLCSTRTFASIFRTRDQ